MLSDTNVEQAESISIPDLVGIPLGVINNSILKHFLSNSHNRGRDTCEIAKMTWPS